MPQRVYVHVGLPKTGTSYVQAMLWGHKQELAAQDIGLPGDDHQFQRRGVWDLTGRRLYGVDQPDLPGSWRALVEAVSSAPERSVLLSEEYLVHARAAQVRKIIRAFAPAEVHVVVTVRDLGRVIGSMWQHEVSQGATWPWPEFVAAVSDPTKGPPTAGVGFWLRYDPQRVIALWQQFVPAEQIHVVAVPGAGAPPSRLLELFCRATGVDTRAMTPVEQPQNSSVGVTESEVLRRLNLRLGGRLNERQYLRVFERALKPALRERGSSPRLEIAAEYRPWLFAKSDEIVSFLQTAPFDIRGDLDDLRPDPATLEGIDPSALDPALLLDAGLSALSAVTEEYATFWWRVRRRKDVDGASRPEQLVSSGRAMAYKAKAKSLELADRNRVFAEAARLYLRRRSRP